MPDNDEKLINFVAQENGIGMEKLMQKMEMRNRNTFYKFVKQMEEREIIKTEKEGRSRRVYLKSPDKKVDKFINTFGNRLDLYEKEINKYLALLEKNLPLISKDQPMKRVKMKVGVLEFDKERRMYRDMGKTQDSHGYTWKTRAKPRKHFDTTLELLHKLYQESSVLSFSEFLVDDDVLIKGYQKRSDKLIKETVRKIENMFRGERDFAFAIDQIRRRLYALVYRAILKEQIKKA